MAYNFKYDHPEGTPLGAAQREAWKGPQAELQEWGKTVDKELSKYDKTDPRYNRALEYFGTKRLDDGKVYRFNPDSGTIEYIADRDIKWQREQDDKWNKASNEWRAANPQEVSEEWRQRQEEDPNIVERRAALDQSVEQYRDQLGQMPMLGNMFRERAMGNNMLTDRSAEVARQAAMRDIAAQTAMAQGAAGYNPALARQSIMSQGRVGGDIAARIAEARAMEQQQAMEAYASQQQQQLGNVFQQAAADQALLAQEHGIWGTPSGFGLSEAGQTGGFVNQQTANQIAQQANDRSFGMDIAQGILGFGGSALGMFGLMGGK